jgi:MATE family multidrug resistance protein
MSDQKKPLLSEASTADAADRRSACAEFWDMSGMAVQLSLTRIARMLLTTIDAAFLGHLGTQQLAGVALSAMWQGVPSTLVQFTLQALTPLASQARGAKQNKLVGEWWQTSMLVAVIGCIPVMAVFWNVHYFVALTMDDEMTVEYSKRFSRVMMWTLLPQFLYVGATSYFSVLGVVTPATVCTCITVVCNIAFNQCFIYGFDYTKWNDPDNTGYFEGSPLATVVSSWLQLALFLTYCVLIKGYHVNAPLKPGEEVEGDPNAGKFWFGWNTKKSFGSERMRQFLALGVPTGLSSVVDWLSGAIAGSFSGWAGVQTAAGQNVLNGLFALTYSTVSGFSTATQIRLARYLGEGKPDEAKRILRIGGTSLLMGGIIVCGVVLIWHHKIWGVWTSDEVLKDNCDGALASFMAGVMSAYLRFTLTIVMCSLGPREAYINLVANNIASWVIYIPLAYVMPLKCSFCLDWGLSGFWWSDFCGEAFKVAVLTWGVSRVDWAEASRNARAAAGAMQSPKETEEQEARLFASTGAITSPAGNTNTGNVAIHSPGLLARNAQENLNSAGLGNMEMVIEEDGAKA